MPISETAKYPSRESAYGGMSSGARKRKQRESCATRNADGQMMIEFSGEKPTIGKYFRVQKSVLPLSINREPYLGLEKIFDSVFWEYGEHLATILTLTSCVKTVVGNESVRNNVLRYIFQNLQSSDVLPFMYGWVGTQGRYVGIPVGRIRKREGEFPDVLEFVQEHPYNLNQLTEGINRIGGTGAEKHIRKFEQSLVSGVIGLRDFGYKLILDQKLRMAFPLETALFRSAEAIGKLPESIVPEVIERFKQDIKAYNDIVRLLRNESTKTHFRRNLSFVSSVEHNSDIFLEQIKTFLKNMAYNPEIDNERIYPFRK